MLSYRWVIESFYDFVQKARDDEALGHGDGNAAGAQIKQFVLVDLTGRCAMPCQNKICAEYRAGSVELIAIFAARKLWPLLQKRARRRR
jgi:hypothetical protein